MLVSAWSELPVYDVHTAAGAGTLVQGEFQLDTLMVPTSLLSEFDLLGGTEVKMYCLGSF